MDVRKHPDGGIRVGKCNHHSRRPGEASRGQRFAPRAVCENDGIARQRSLAHSLRIQVQRDVPNPLRFEKACQPLAVAAIPQDHDVAV